MNTNSNHIEPHLSKDRMLAYLSGELVDAEAYSVELHMLDCVLCRDAIEGMETLSDSERIATLNELGVMETLSGSVRTDAMNTPGGMELIRREVQSEATPGWFYPLAASLVLLLISALVTLIFPGDTVREQPLADAKAPVVTDTLSAPTQIKEDRTAEMLAETSSPEPARNEQAKPLNETSDLIAEQPVDAMADQANDAGASLAMAVFETDMSKAAAVRSDAVTNLPAIAQKEGATTRKITGKVIFAEDDQPAPGAAVQAAAGNTTTTNALGRYTITVPSQTKTLTASSLGMVQTSVDLPAGDTLDIVLIADLTVLQEVVTSDDREATAKKRNKARLAATEEKLDSKTSPPAPPQGMKAWVEKIEKQLAANSDLQRIEGQTISMAFNVQPDGRLTDVRALVDAASPCAHWAEVYIRNAGKWSASLQNGVPQAGDVVVEIKCGK